MKLEQQVTSKDLSMRLKKLGVKQESLFFYSGIGIKRTAMILLSSEYRQTEPFICSAFTVAELGEVLSPCSRYYCEYNNGEWQAVEDCGYDTYPVTKDNKLLGEQIASSTEADTRAKLLIHLIEEKIINLEE